MEPHDDVDEASNVAAAKAPHASAFTLTYSGERGVVWGAMQPAMR